MKKYIAGCILTLLLGGCCLIPGYQPLMNLKNLGDNRSQTAAYLKGEEDRYKKLELDLRNEELKEGTSKEELFSRYGRPVFSRAAEDPAGAAEVLIYRHPTGYFSSDLLYLYLDKEGRFFSYRREPAPLIQEREEQEGP